jgi:hypothetical protein
MGSKGGGDQDDYYRKQEEERQAAIREGTAAIDTTFSQFDDGFYDQQRQAYLNFAMPQIEDQRTDAQKELTFALARNGQLESSSRASLAGELQKQYDLQSQSIADQALDYETQARNGVETARSDLILTLNATGDAAGAANSSLARADALSTTPAYNPITGLFADFTSGLGTAVAAERARAYGYGGANPSSGSATLYSPSSNSVTVR